MKYAFPVIVLSLLFFISCKKTVADGVPIFLNGTWKMIKVTDDVTHATTTKPSSITGDVIITFVPGNASGGTFFGNTPTNEIVSNDYLLGANQTISITNLAMSQVMETSWGFEFVNNIINAENYDFAAGELIIKTTDKTLTFEKL